MESRHVDGKGDDVSNGLKTEKRDYNQRKSVIYLDYNATTPLEPEVIASIQDALTDAWGNPSSSHEAGKKAKAIIDAARENVGKMIGAKSSDIVFTSGGTEANNMILQTAVDYFHKIRAGSDTESLPHIISSRMEHPAITEMLHHLEVTKQAEVTYVPISKVTGTLEASSVLEAVQQNTIMVTVMLANNETGIIQPVAEICKAVQTLKRSQNETQRILVHTDAAQAIGKIPVDVENLGIDYLTIVGHKFYGPRIGAVYARGLENNKTPLYPMLFGGGQERYYRPGTENTGMIAGLGKACELVYLNIDKYKKHMEECRNYLETKLQTAFQGRIHFNGKLEGSERLPNTCNVSILGENLQGQKVLSACKRIQASVGAACHAQNKPSAILLATGIPENIARNALRLSLGRTTTLTDIDKVVDDLIQAVNTVQAET